jgi:predicted O-methyltransferase YrrM
VSDIARYSSVPKKYGILLANMARSFGRSGILEFGTSLGISTMYMAASIPDAEIITMEGCPATSEIANENFRKSELNNITSLTGSFDELLPELRRKGVSPGLVFVDGNHRREPVLKYFNEVTEMSGPESVVILDDIHSSRSMSDAWNEIKKHEKVTSSVDVFRMGMVFFRSGMARYDYTVRY